MVEEDVSKVKEKKKNINILRALGVIVIALAVTIVVVFVINKNNNRYQPTIVDDENEGIVKQAEILNKFKTQSDYTVNDTVADFKAAIKECNTAGCRVYIKIAYARFMFDYTENLDSCLGIMGDAENDLGESSDTVRKSYYLAMQSLMLDAGRESEAESYGKMADEYSLK